MKIKSNLIIIFLSLFIFFTAPAQSKENDIVLENPLSMVTINDLIKDKNALKKFHPGVFVNFSESKYDSIIGVVAKSLPTEKIKESEKNLIRRRVLDYFTYEDPHLRFIPNLTLQKGTKMKSKNIKVLPFDCLCIHDTLIVDKSYNTEINKGDRIISINDESITKYLQSSYQDRYMPSVLLQGSHHLKFSYYYDLILERSGEIIKMRVEGIAVGKTIYGIQPFTEQINEVNETGYFRIDNFDFNSYLVKRLKRFLRLSKKNNIKKVIIDLRKNRGGSGDQFDKLFSLLTDRKSITYQSGAKIKVSDVNFEEYGFPQDSIGLICSLPLENLVKEFYLDNEKYIGDFQYYILISKDTGSIAASFANIMEYNNIGILIGEPLAHNALKYGDEITASRDNSRWMISTIQYEEYSKSVDGVLFPDISIPFIAKEYMMGGDPVMENCLEYIKNDQKE